jgi:hypothetical protein
VVNAISDERNWFNFQKWSANTVLTLVNVPWGNDYQHLQGFDTRQQLDAYIDAKPNAVIRKFSYAKFNRDVSIDTPINAAMRYNYIRAANPAMPVDGDIERTYYYFIAGYEYVGPKNTRLKLQLDVWSSFFEDVQFGRCLVDRSHIGIANQNAFEQFGRSYLSVPEGLDTGAEYRVVHKERTKIMDTAGVVDADPGYDVLVCSTLDLTQPPGTEENPSLKTSHGGNWNGVPSGASFYIFPTGLDLQKFMTSYSDKPWITQSIVSLKIIPNMKRYSVSGFDYGADLGNGDFHFYEVTSAFYSSPPIPKSVTNMPNWRAADFISNILGDDYKGLQKFLTYPYMVIELTAHNGSPVLLRPESWQDPDAKVTELAAFVSPGERIAIYPARYNADAETQSETQTDNLHDPNGTLIDDNGESLDVAVVMDAFPSLPIVNNMGIAYLAQNRNGIAFSFQNASWGKERARAAAQAGATVAGAQIGNTSRQAGIANRNASQQAAISTNARMAGSVLGAAADIGGGAARGGPAGAGVGALGGVAGIGAAAIGSSAELESTNAGISARGESAISDVQTAGQIRDTNLDFANFAAQGDYENAHRGILANIQDAALTQPSVSGQFAGDAFNLVQGLSGYVLTWKMPNKQILRQIGNYWLRYGYAVQQYITPPANLHCMSKFTYWKMTEAQLLPVPIPEGFKQIIRGIFETGTTIWKNPDDIPYLPLADNAPLTGISY